MAHGQGSSDAPSSKEHHGGGTSRREFLLEMSPLYLAGMMVASIVHPDQIDKFIEKAGKGMDFLLGFFSGPISNSGGGAGGHESG